MTHVWKALHLDEQKANELVKVLRGGHTLSRLVLERVRGLSDVRVAVPAEIDPRSIGDLGHGGVCRQGPSFRLLADGVQEHLSAHESNCLILEDYLARATDPVLEKAEVPWVRYGEEVYYVLSGDVVDRSLIEAGLRRASDPVHFVGLLSRRYGVGREGEISLQELQQLVDDASLVFVGIFDGESFATFDERGQAA